MGDGFDTIWGLRSDDTLNISEENWSSIGSNKDIIITVGEGTITLKDARYNPPQVTVGDSNKSGGGSNNGNNNGSNSSNGNGSGNSGDKDNPSGGISADEGKSSDATQSKSASGSSGRGTSTGLGNRGGNDAGNVNSYNYYYDNKLSATPFSSPFDALRTTTPVVNQHVYAGGNQIINDYQSGEKIIFGAAYTGAMFDDAGNFLVGSSTGALAVTNATDKVIDLLDAAGNEFLKAYAASTAALSTAEALQALKLSRALQARILSLLATTAHNFGAVLTLRRIL